jgi:hypothetical protein
MMVILASLLTRSCVMLMLILIDGGHLSQFIDPFLRHVDADINNMTQERVNKLAKMTTID